MKRYSLPPLLCLLTLSTLLLAACTQASEQKVFPQEYRLTGERVPHIPAYSSLSEIKNGILISISYVGIQTYSAIDYSSLHSLIGQSDSRIFQTIHSSSPYHIYVMEVDNKNMIRKYEIDSLGLPRLLQTGFIGVDISMHCPYILRDSLIVYDEFVPEAAIKIHNLRTNMEERSLHYGTTSLNDRFFDKNMGGLYSNDSCIVFAYKYQDRIDFYDWQLNLKRSINNQKSAPVIDTTCVPFPPEDIYYYGNSYMGRNYFYTLYRGVSNKVFRSDSLLIDKNNNIYLYGLTCDVLEVYELNGEPVCRFHFDDIAPGPFIVDEEQNRLFSTRGGGNPLVYQLQGLPKNGKKYPEYKYIASSLPSTPEPQIFERINSFRRILYEPDVSPSYLVFFNGNIACVVTKAKRVMLEEDK